MFSIEFRNLGLRLPILEFSEMYFSYARLLAFGVALVGMVVVYLFLTRTYIGAAIRAISQDREIMVLMGVDAKKIYWVTAGVGGGLAGLAACLLVLQYDVHPFVGISFGPITFIICVLGGLGNMIGGFIAAFILSIIISVGGLYSEIEWGIRFSVCLLHSHDVHPTSGFIGENDDKNYSFYNWPSTPDCTLYCSAVSASFIDNDINLVFSLHSVVFNGPLRTGITWTWCLYEYRCICNGLTMELWGDFALDWNSCGDDHCGNYGLSSGLSLFPI